MIRTRNKATSTFIPMAAEAEEWEVRPGGMLVQKRSPDSESAAAAAAAVVPTIRVKVKYESAYYEIYISSESTFGQLKKLVAERTGFHPEDQKIMYKEKEREGNVYLDVCGVKDRSKMVMVVDPAARARRVLEMHQAAKSERAAKAVKDVSAEMDRLAMQVSDMEATISKGKKVADKDVSNLIEQLMTQLIKLDGVVPDGNLKLQKGMQVRRVQKYVEELDMIKIKNAKIASSSTSSQQQQQPLFDSLFAPSTSVSKSMTKSNLTTSPTIGPSYDWELF